MMPVNRHRQTRGVGLVPLYHRIGGLGGCGGGGRLDGPHRRTRHQIPVPRATTARSAAPGRCHPAGCQPPPCASVIERQIDRPPVCGGRRRRRRGSTRRGSGGEDADHVGVDQAERARLAPCAAAVEEAIHQRGRLGPSRPGAAVHAPRRHVADPAGNTRGKVIALSAWVAPNTSAEARTSRASPAVWFLARSRRSLTG